jgi:cell division protein FtsZ
MLKRRDFIRRVFTAGVVLGSTSFDIFSANFLPQIENGKAKKEDRLFKIKVLGLGGCGGKAIDYMIQSGLKGVDFIVADREPRFVTSSLIGKQLFLKTEFSKIGKVKKGGSYSDLENDKQKIRQALEGSDMVFIIAGMGGETETFWAPIIAQISNELDILTLAVITSPLCCEASGTRIRAEIGIEKLSTIADTVITVDFNDSDLRVYPDIPFSQVYEQADKILLSAVKEITGLIVSPGPINLDLRDIKISFSKEGLASFATGVASGRGRAKQAAQKAFSDLLYRGHKPASYQQMVVSLTVGHNATYEELTEAIGVIRKETQDKVTIVWGTCLDQAIGAEFRVTVFITGRDYKKPCWFQNIFYQVNNKSLILELKSLAKGMNCIIREGEPLTPDIIATPYFISIVDRSLIGEECWNLFLRFCRETKDDTPIIIVDKLRHLKLPDHKNILFVDLNNPQAIDEIKSTILEVGV